jgi:hypothetical protein
MFAERREIITGARNFRITRPSFKSLFLHSNYQLCTWAPQGQWYTALTCSFTKTDGGDVISRNCSVIGWGVLFEDGRVVSTPLNPKGLHGVLKG